VLRRFGIHLPHTGHASGPDSITRVAQHAEALGFDDLWVSDHVVVPASQGYPKPYIYDPLLTLTWAASCTSSIGLGTTVLVVPQYQPVQLANSLASLDALSRGRLTLGAGVGWSAGEYAALGQDFGNRGRRMDEILAVLRACWRDDPVTFEGEFYRLDTLRLLPKPAHDIPIWVGGVSPAAIRRASVLGDGYHTIGLSIEEAPAVVERVRRHRPEDSFTISLRTGWDTLGMEPDLIRNERDAFDAAGIQHVVAVPWRSDLDSYLRAVEDLARILELDPRGSAGIR
jgi:probable F420-dependent oxidoreductase